MKPMSKIKMAERLKNIFNDFKKLTKEQQEHIYLKYEAETENLLTKETVAGDRLVERFLLDLRDLLKSVINDEDTFSRRIKKNAK